MAAPMYSFFRGNFPDVEFFAAQRYLHVTEKGPEESQFGPLEAPACQWAVIQLIYCAEADH